MVLPNAETVSCEEEKEEIPRTEVGCQTSHRAKDFLLPRRVRQQLYLVIASAVLEETVQVRRVAHGAREIRNVTIGVLVNPNKQCVSFHFQPHLFTIGSFVLSDMHGVSTIPTIKEPRRTEVRKEEGNAARKGLVSCCRRADRTTLKLRE